MNFSFLLFYFSRPHSCNKTKTQELYKSCKTLAAYEDMLYFIHEHIFL